MQHFTEVYCPGCQLVVTSADPERIQKDLKVYHEPCLRRKQRKDEEEQFLKQKLLAQSWRAA